jgi:hypothetical protein
LQVHFHLSSGHFALFFLAAVVEAVVAVPSEVAAEAFVD